MANVDQIKPLGPAWRRLPVERSDERQRPPERPAHNDRKKRNKDDEDNDNGKPQIDEYA